MCDRIRLQGTLAELVRGRAGDSSEGVAEIRGAVESALKGDFLDGHAGRFEKLLRLFHAALYDELVGG